ncbi:triose-phosphate transporter family-domain-containing protein [Dipodascopsis uninucleata]
MASRLGLSRSSISGAGANDKLTAAEHDPDDELGDEIAFNIDDEDPFTSNPIQVEQKIVEKKITDALLIRKIMFNAAFIFLWYFFSLSLSMYNKWMFSDSHLNFQFPLFATSYHMVIQTLISGLVLVMIPRFRPNPEAKMGWKVYITHVGACGVATGADIGLGNMSLRFITLGFYTMVKSSNLVFVLLFAFLFKLERPTLQLISIIGLMTTGVIMMVASEAQFVLIGFILVLTAAILSGFRWSITQILLKKHEATSNPFSTIFYLAPIMCLTLLILALFIEGLSNLLTSSVWAQQPFYLWILILTMPGILACMMTAAEFFLLHKTNVVTLSIVGIFKEIVTIAASAGVFGDKLTAINISGLIVTLIAIGLYNYIRIKKMRQKIEDKVTGKGLSVSLESENTNNKGYTPVAVTDEYEMSRLSPITPYRTESQEFFDSESMKQNGVFSTKNLDYNIPK